MGTDYYGLNAKELNYVNSIVPECEELVRELCRIPSPSHCEGAKAEFCRKYLEKAGAKNVYIDGADNVILPIAGEKQDVFTAFAAHTDTVFPDKEPLPYYEDREYIRCAGVGDNTVCLAIMLVCAKYIVTRGIKPAEGLLFVADTCEEGLGNLKGCREFVGEYGSKIKEFIAIDGKYDAVVNKCVGSHRYKIKIMTQGGHSFRDFGSENAINRMSELITRLYKIKVPNYNGGITTYNVGVINGGTSVNTIAQECELLYEYRSDDRDCLEFMRRAMNEEIEYMRSEYENIEIDVELLGERPCGSTPNESQRKKSEDLTRLCIDISERYSGLPCQSTLGSTDCNIPMSLGIPAICVGAYNGGGAHTREEWLEKKSIPCGIKIILELILNKTR